MRRKQLRLKAFDYKTSGAYFITVCVMDKLALLAEIQNQEVSLSSAGEIVNQTWLSLPEHYGGIELDEFVVMPNHIHGLIWIRNWEVDKDEVGAGFKPAPTRHGLSEWVRGFKTSQRGM